MSGGRKITLVSSAPGSGPAGPVTKEAMEAGWAANVRQFADGRSVSMNISMGGRSMDDKTAKLWCSWFEGHCASIVRRGSKATARDVNFSENRLTSAGVSDICKTLLKLEISVAVLKLYKNQIEKADPIVDFLSFGKGSLRELHLSHNCLDTKAARDIILTCAKLNDSKGEPCYPRAGTVPIWLRLESNDKINGPKLGPELQTGLQRTGRPIRKAICEVDGKSHCNPGSCCRACTPAVHLTYMRIFQCCDPEVVSTKKALPAQPATSPAGTLPGGPQVAANALTSGTAARGWGKPNTTSEPAVPENVSSSSAPHVWPQLGESSAKAVKADVPSLSTDIDNVNGGDPSTASPIWPQLSGQSKGKQANTEVASEQLRPGRASQAGSPDETKGSSKSSDADVVLGESEFPSLGAPANKAKPALAKRQRGQSDCSDDAANSGQTKTDASVKQGGQRRGWATPQLLPAPDNDAAELRPPDAVAQETDKLPHTGESLQHDLEKLGESEFPSLGAPANKAKPSLAKRQRGQSDCSDDAAKIGLTETDSSVKQGGQRRWTTPQQLPTPNNDVAVVRPPDVVAQGTDKLPHTEESLQPELAVRPPPGLEHMYDEPPANWEEHAEKTCSETTVSTTVSETAPEAECNTTTEVCQTLGLEATLNEAPPISGDSAAKCSAASITSLMVAVEDYHAEADGYVSVKKGDHVTVWLEFQAPGDSGCAFPTYTYAKVGSKSQTAGDGTGWIPPHVVWDRYVDDEGRGWAHDASTGQILWEDEI